MLRVHLTFKKCTFIVYNNEDSSCESFLSLGFALQSYR